MNRTLITLSAFALLASTGLATPARVTRRARHEQTYRHRGGIYAWFHGRLFRWDCGRWYACPPSHDGRYGHHGPPRHHRGRHRPPPPEHRRGRGDHGERGRHGPPGRP